VIAPALYVGTLRHRRFAVREHAFRHRIAMAYVDLDHLPRTRRPRLLRFDRDDYLPPGRVRELAGADGSVGVLTQPRSLGKGFNPVSFYYAYDRADGDGVGALRAVVAEVTSTPYGQRHAYVLKTATDGAKVHRTAHVDKRLHVSPFLSMDQHYSWATTAPAERLSVHITSHEGDAPAFDATMKLTRAPFRAHRLLGSSVRTLALIYAHATVLAVKRVPMHAPPREVRSP
jgi:DUF1365 family protein